MTTDLLAALADQTLRQSLEEQTAPQVRAQRIALARQALGAGRADKAAALRVLQSRLLLLQKEEEAAKKKELAGVITAAWGDQMRSYVLAPYQMVKDLRTEYEVNNPQAVFDGDLDGFIAAGIRHRKQKAN